LGPAIWGIALWPAMSQPKSETIYPRLTLNRAQIVTTGQPRRVTFPPDFRAPGRFCFSKRWSPGDQKPKISQSISTIRKS